MEKLSGMELIAAIRLVNAIRQHAINNYSTGGWDYLVECWGDADILDCIGTTSNLRNAISKCSKTLKLMDDYRAEQRASFVGY